MNLKVAVFSDIHGNYVAFERCFEYALGRGVTTFLFLGDYLGELAYPQRTMERLYRIAKEYTCYFIRGNKEDYWLNYQASGEKGWTDGDSTTGALFYTYSALTQKDLDFFAGLPIVRKVEFDDLPSITICHGSPEDAKAKLMEQENMSESLKDVDSFMVLCGHTHRQGKRFCKDKIVMNPGSVGVPLGSDGKAQFLILQGKEGAWESEFVSLSYDAEQVIADLREEKMEQHAPCWSIITEKLLRDGKIPHGRVLNRVMQLVHDDTGEWRWPDLPDKYWTMAMKEFFGGSI